MQEQELEKLIDPNKYQVFVCMSGAAFPFITFWHMWFVVNQKGKVDRFEIKVPSNKEKSLGHMHINRQPPFQGLPLFLYIHKFFQPTKVLKVIEGDEDSLAKKLADFLENSPNTYPYIKDYSLIGPNCNTYIEWVLKNFPEIELDLSWNAIGKNYKSA